MPLPIMPQSVTTCLILFLAPTLSLAQVVDDSLDWHRYFPLEIGNEWQYYDAESGPVSRFVISRDTVVNSQHYYVGHETFFAPGGSGQNVYPPREVFLRYDTTGVVAESDSPEADTGSVSEVFFRGRESFPTVDLRSAFGDTLDYSDEQEAIGVSGGFQEYVRIGSSEILSAAVKRFSTGLWFWSYAADVGFRGGGNLWGPRLAYARIGGTEYGSIIVSKESVDKPEGPSGLKAPEIYPNPATGTIEIAFDRTESARTAFEVFSVAGRRVDTFDVGSRASSGSVVWTVDISSFPAGVYFLRTTSDSGISTTSPFVVVK